MTIPEKVSEIKRQKDQYLIPENIKQGVTILGIEGNLSSGAKVFENTTEMYKDEYLKEDQLAIIFRQELLPMKEDMTARYISFPESVTLPNKQTTSEEIYFRLVDESTSWADCRAYISSQYMDFMYYSDTTQFSVEYSSTDGITYVRQSEVTNPIDLGAEIYCPYPEDMWSDAAARFIYVTSNYFDSLYQCKPKKSTKIMYGQKIFSGDGFSMPEELKLFDISDIPLLTDIPYLAGASRGFDIYPETWVESKFQGQTVYKVTRALIYNWSNSTYIKNNSVVYYSISSASDERAMYLWDATAGITKYRMKDQPSIQITSSISNIAGAFNLIDKWVLPEVIVDDNGELATSFDLAWGVTYYNSDSFPTSVSSSYEILRPACTYGSELKYQIAQTQFNLTNSNQLLPGYTALGKSTSITGDGSIYENLDNSKIAEKVGLEYMYKISTNPSSLFKQGKIQSLITNPDGDYTFYIPNSEKDYSKLTEVVTDIDSYNKSYTVENIISLPNKILYLISYRPEDTYIRKYKGYVFDDQTLQFLAKYDYTPSGNSDGSYSTSAGILYDKDNDVLYIIYVGTYVGFTKISCEDGHIIKNVEVSSTLKGSGDPRYCLRAGNPVVMGYDTNYGYKYTFVEMNASTYAITQKTYSHSSGFSSYVNKPTVMNNAVYISSYNYLNQGTANHLFKWTGSAISHVTPKTHSDILTDGTYLYLSDSSNTYKYNSSMSLVSTISGSSVIRSNVEYEIYDMVDYKNYKYKDKYRYGTVTNGTIKATAYAMPAVYPILREDKANKKYVLYGESPNIKLTECNTLTRYSIEDGIASQYRALVYSDEYTFFISISEAGNFSSNEYNEALALTQDILT